MMGGAGQMMGKGEKVLEYLIDGSETAEKKGLGRQRCGWREGTERQTDTRSVFVCVCCQECVSARKEGIGSDNLIILTLTEGHKGIMEVKYCIPLVV